MWIKMAMARSRRYFNDHECLGRGDIVAVSMLFVPVMLKYVEVVKIEANKNLDPFFLTFFPLSNGKKRRKRKWEIQRWREVES